jgi:competence protein ComEC
VVPVFICLIVVGLAGGIFWLGRIPPTAAAAVVAGIWGGIAMSQVFSSGNMPSSVRAYTDGPSYIISGRITSFARQYPRKTRYVVSCETLRPATDSTPFKVTGKIYLSVYKNSDESDLPPLLYGSRIRFAAKLRSIRNFANPGGFDYERFLLFKGITASAWTNTDRIRMLPQPRSLLTGIIQKLQQARQHGHEFILSRAGPNGASLPINLASDLKADAAAVLSAMVLGQKSDLSHDLRDRFSRAGISHLLAISGLHLSIIGLLAYLTVLQTFRPFPAVVNAGMAKKICLCLTLFPLVGYAVLAGFSPATQRALIMASTFILAMILDRETDPVNVLCLAGILILSLDPTALFSISFQLSFSAVAAIILGMILVNKKNLLPRSKWLARIVTIFWVSLFAGLACLPLTALYFNTVSCIFMFSNLIFVPALGFVCLPLGLAATACLYLHPFVATVLMDLALTLVCLLLVFASALGESCLTWFRIVTPSILEVGLYYLLLTGVLTFFHKRKRFGAGLIAVSAVAGLCCLALDLKQRFYPGQLTATVLDVGQGASSLVRTPKGKSILLDCGGFSSGSGFNVGRYVVGPYLWRNKIKTIDLVVLSHPQADHMNGLDFILDNFRVRRVIRNKDIPAAENIQGILEKLGQANIPVTIPAFPGIALDLGKARFFFYPASGHSQSDLNHNCLVARLVYKQFSMLITGDIDAKRELSLCRQDGVIVSSRIMLAPHHGSRTASSKIFLDQVNPESVIVSCGYGNRYGFPHAEVLRRYESEKIKVFRTDLHGAVTICTRGGDYHMTTFRNH